MTMAQVRIRQAVAQRPWPRWHFVTFGGQLGRDSRGVVDFLAVRKNHGQPRCGTKRGDDLEIILVQVKGGSAAMPTAEDGKRLRLVKKRHFASEVLLATWRKGEAAQFFTLRQRAIKGLNGWKRDWEKVSDLRRVFDKHSRLK